MYEYDKDKLISLIKKAKGEDKTVSKFAEEMGVSRPYLNNLLNKKQKNPPSPDILQKVAGNNNQVRYVELMVAAGYLGDEYILDENKNEEEDINKKDSDSYVVEEVNRRNPREIVKSINDNNIYDFVESKKETLHDGKAVFPEGYVTDSSFAVRMTDNKFENMGIIKDDHLLIRPITEDPKNGTTILVIIKKGGDYVRTVKRIYFINENKVRLEPDTEGYGVIDKSEIEIIGLIVYMGRKYIK